MQKSIHKSKQAKARRRKEKRKKPLTLEAKKTLKRPRKEECNQAEVNTHAKRLREEDIHSGTGISQDDSDKDKECGSQCDSNEGALRPIKPESPRCSFTLHFPLKSQSKSKTKSKSSILPQVALDSAAAAHYQKLLRQQRSKLYRANLKAKRDFSILSNLSNTLRLRLQSCRLKTPKSPLP